MHSVLRVCACCVRVCVCARRTGACVQVLIFDLGGGTFDVSILAIEKVTLGLPSH